MASIWLEVDTTLYIASLSPDQPRRIDHVIDYFGGAFGGPPNPRAGSPAADRTS